MRIDENLIKKYSKTGPRYTSYPPATFFDDSFSNLDFEKKIIQSNDENPQNISVYIHIPFCPQICHFCGCTTESGFTKPFLERYVDAVIKEISYVSKLINKNRKLTQIHWEEEHQMQFHINTLKELPKNYLRFLIFPKTMKWQLNAIPLTWNSDTLSY